MTQPLPTAGPRAGRYELVELIGEGGYGPVYRGYDPRIELPVAIESCASADRDTRERLCREAAIAGSLDHPNIVRVHDLFVDAGIPHLVRELLDGETLEQRLERRAWMPFGERLYYLIQIARGLDYAHQRGVIHHDLKPANVRVLEDCSAKIQGFGVARLTRPDGGPAQETTAPGAAAYPALSPPPGETATPAADILAFGALAHELLTGERLFGPTPLADPVDRGSSENSAPRAAYPPDCPADLVALVARCLDDDPADSSFRAILEELERIRDLLRATRLAAPPAAATRTLPAPAAPLPPRVDLPLRTPVRAPRVAGVASRRRRSRWWASLPLLLLAAGASAWLWLPAGSTPSWLERFRSTASADSAGARSPLGEEAPPAAVPGAEPERTGPPVGVAPAPPPAAEEPRSDATAAVEPSGSTWPERTVAGEPATVSFSSVWHPGIRLSVDGGEPAVLGRSRVLELAPGPHSLTFSLDADGYRASETVRIRLAAGDTRVVPVPIAPPGRLTVQAHLGSPQGVLRIGSHHAALATPVHGRAIEPGRHRLDLYLPRDQSRPVLTTAVTIRSGRETIVTFDLRGARPPNVRERRLR